MLFSAERSSTSTVMLYSLSQMINSLTFLVISYGSDETCQRLISRISYEMTTHVRSAINVCSVDLFRLKAIVTFDTACIYGLLQAKHVSEHVQNAWILIHPMNLQNLIHAFALH